jgi:EmrB/QacA subfamily drug resistance transporter
MTATATRQPPPSITVGDREERLPWSTWRLAAVIAFGAFMSGLDASIVNVGLETIARDLHATIGTTQWVANGYLIALAVSLPVCGWLGRRVGVGRLWLAALAGFTATSGLCALADTIHLLIGVRVLQGLTAGLLIPAGQTVIGQAVGSRRLGVVMATLGVAVALAPALGPTVGGLVIHLASWPWLFLVNLPLGALALLLGLRYVPGGEPAPVGRLDWRGLLLVTAGLPLVVYGLTTWGERRTLDTPGVLVPLLAGLTALAAFAAHARRRDDPVLNVRLFSRPTYAAASATAAFTGAALFGAGLLFPLYFQIGRNQSVLATGLLLISLSAGTALALPASGRLVDRHGGGIVSLYGGVAAVVTTAPFALLDPHTNHVVVQLLLLARGMAIALAVMPATTAAYKAVTTAQLPDATTEVNIVLRVGGALGGAIFAVVLAAELPHGVDGAFRTAFWWLTAASALGVAAAAWLTAAERHTS